MTVRIFAQWEDDGEQVDDAHLILDEQASGAPTDLLRDIVERSHSEYQKLRAATLLRQIESAKSYVNEEHA